MICDGSTNYRAKDQSFSGADTRTRNKWVLGRVCGNQVNRQPTWLIFCMELVAFMMMMCFRRKIWKLLSRDCENVADGLLILPPGESSHLGISSQQEWGI
jgi:hypothetical protein